MGRFHVRTASAGLTLVVATLAFQLSSGSALASGFSTLLADKSAYQIGDPIRLCWLLPAAGTMTLSNHFATGATQVVHTGDDKGTGCLSGKVIGPVGHTCEVLDFNTPRGQGSEQACFDVSDTPAPDVQPVAGQPALTAGDVLGDDQSELEINGVGFQTFSAATHGVTLAVKGPDGTDVDSDELFPNVDGTLRVVLHTANYAPGDYAVSARYSFINGYNGAVNVVSTQLLADGPTFTIQ